jgi:hypothetical protein
MNERIKELAKKVGTYHPTKDAIALVNEDIEQFAEMIVRECIEVIGDTAASCPNGEYDLAEKDFVTNILNNFGVKP